jgi:hypothetical protein
MNPKFYVISGRKVGSRMAAAAFFAAKGGPCHQSADRDERRNATAIVTQRRVPLIERLNGSSQERFLAP